MQQEPASRGVWQVSRYIEGSLLLGGAEILSFIFLSFAQPIPAFKWVDAPHGLFAGRALLEHFFVLNISQTNPCEFFFTVCQPVRFTFDFLFSAYVIEGCVKCFEELTAPCRVDTIKEERISLDALYVGCTLALRDSMWDNCPKGGWLRCSVIYLDLLVIPFRVIKFRVEKHNALLSEHLPTHKCAFF